MGVEPLNMGNLYKYKLKFEDFKYSNIAKLDIRKWYQSIA